MLSNLNEAENYIMQLFFDYFPSQRSIIEEQIHQADICRTSTNTNYFVDFNFDHRAARACELTGVPVKMILGSADIPPSQILRRLNGHIVTNAACFPVPDEEALGIHFYFQAGYLCELEVYSIAGNPVQLKELNMRPVTYLIESAYSQ